MATTAATVTLNAAFLQEIKDDNLELRHLFEECRQALPHRASAMGERRRFVDLLGRLRDQLAMHFALEEAYGYFDDPVTVSSRLSSQTAALRAQHRDLFLDICALADRGESLVYHEAHAGAVRALTEHFRAFDRSLQDHEQRENDLIMRTLYDDIGVGD